LLKISNDVNFLQLADDPAGPTESLATFSCNSALPREAPDASDRRGSEGVLYFPAHFELGRFSTPRRRENQFSEARRLCGPALKRFPKT
jgi:hypothetical protein